MNDPAIVEAGTHGELLEHEGSDYGRLWHASAGVLMNDDIPLS